MDLIPQPRDPFLAIHVALVQPLIPYDFVDFATFPVRHDLARLSTDGSSLIERARYLQSWLFFGLLAEYLGDAFRVGDFVVPSAKTSEGQLLTLKHLQARSLDGEGQVSRMSRWESHAETACTIAWTEINKMESLGLLSDSPAGDTALAILVLVRTLRVMTMGPSRSEESCASWDSAFLRRRMYTAGWCPQQTVALFDLHDPIVLCYLASLRPNEGHSVSHKNCSGTACVANNVRLDTGYQHRHVSDGCTCNFVTVDVEAVKGVIRGGGIPLVSIQREEHGTVSLRINKASSRSEYVAISHVWSDGLGNPTANALPHCQLERLSECLTEIPSESNASDSDDYLSRGIRLEASPKNKAEGLRKRVQSTVFPTQAKKEFLFWMDTLCIPVTASTNSPAVVADINELKSMAINQMALIYAGSSRVLVLDSGLQSVPVEPSKSSSDIEVLARFACSTWMRRCWTLQEGALSQKICFQSASGVVTPLTPTKNAVDPESTEIANGFVPWLLPWGAGMYLRHRAKVKVEREVEHAGRTDPIVTYLRYRLQESVDKVINLLSRGLQSHNTVGQANPESQLRQFCVVWNNLADRNTTMAEDLPAIFANLLDINAYQILALPPTSRLKAILSSLDVLPLDLLFHDGPRSRADKDGLDRWVPSETNRTKMRLPLLDDESLDQAVGISGTLTWTQSGDLECWHRDGSVAVILNNVDTLRMNTSFIVRIDGTVSKRLPKEILVHVTRPEYDQWLDPGACKEVILLLEMEDPTTDHLGGTKKGFSLLLTSLCKVKSERDTSVMLEIRNASPGTPRIRTTPPSENEPHNDAVAITGQYDCALAWREASQADCQKYLVIEGLTIKDRWQLTIQCEPGIRGNPHSQRPFHQTLTNFIQGIAVMLVLLPLTWCDIAALIIRVIIEVRLGWSNLSPLGRAATVVFALDASRVFSFLTPPPLAQTLFIIDRQRTAGFLSGMDRAYIVLSLMGNMWVAAFVFRIGSAALRYVAYRVWLESFGPNWPEDRGWLWSAYFWTRRWVKLPMA